MSEGMMVTKPTTGDPFFIEDIKVYVPHRQAVFIPVDKVLASRDLHIALNTKAIFALTSTINPGRAVEAPKAPAPVSDDKARMEALERENLALKVRLAEAPKLQTLEQQMRALIEAVGRIEATRQVVTMPAMIHNPAMALSQATEAVGGDVPMFIPDNLAPADVSMNVEIKQEVTGSGSVAGAASKLRQLRKGKPEDK